MLSRLYAVVLLAALFMQSAAAWSPASIAQRAGDIGHWMVHSQEADHHHHADSSLHMENEGAVQHVHVDYSSAAALVNAHHPALLHSEASSLVESGPAQWRSATVVGLLRPPMRRA